jgi:hypothetical protein
MTSVPQDLCEGLCGAWDSDKNGLVMSSELINNVKVGLAVQANLYPNQKQVPEQIGETADLVMALLPLRTYSVQP